MEQNSRPRIFIDESIYESAKKFDDNLKPYQIFEKLLKNYDNVMYKGDTTDIQLKYDVDAFKEYICYRYDLLDNEKNMFNMYVQIHSNGKESGIISHCSNMFTACVMFDKYISFFGFRHYVNQNKILFNNGDYIEKDGHHYTYYSINEPTIFKI